MKTSHFHSPLLIGFLIALGASPASAGAAAVAAAAGGPAAAATVVVRGDVPKPGLLNVADLPALGAVTATWKLHDKSHEVTGVPLEKVLRRFGWEPGVMSKTVPASEKRVGYKRVVVLSAPDGFQAVFSTAELTDGMGKSQVLLVYSVDGKPLPAEQGPLRLVVLTDGEPSRSLYRLASIDLIDMRRIVPPTTDKK